MFTYEPRTFTIPELAGISQKTIDEHLKLYQGYVKNVNAAHEALDELMKDPEKNAFAIGTVQRRLSFEFDGMKNHEYYFSSFEGGPNELAGDSKLMECFDCCQGGYDTWLSRFKMIAKTRGIGWAMLYYDPAVDKLVNFWVEEQHLGQPTGLTPILTLDMWEHSYLFDYIPGDKGKYVDAFFANLNWQTINDRLVTAKEKRG